MNRAELLKAEMAKKFDKETFINMISDRIKARGRICFICGSHVDTKFKDCLYTLSLRDKHLAIDCATSNGFNYQTDYNGYGVELLIFTL